MSNLLKVVFEYNFANCNRKRSMSISTSAITEARDSLSVMNECRRYSVFLRRSDQYITENSSVAYSNIFCLFRPVQVFKLLIQPLSS